MATYTDNYQFTKPTYAEIADVQTFNNNMTKIDEILHASQISLAPAYDPTKPYNAGDVVMYELLMYECQEDGVTGVWDPTKWARTTAGEHGGGSDVEPNPTGEPTATLTKLGIEGTIYGIEGSGGGNVYGAFIDTNRVIYNGFVFDGTEQTWTVTEDCMLAGYLDAPDSSRSCYINIDGIDVFIDYETHNGVLIPVKSGQVISYLGKSSSVMKAYGLTFGTQNIFTPQIYSTEEKCVGAWIDNKPLYAKTIEVSNLVSGNNTVSHNIANIEMTVENLSFLVDSNGYTNQLPAISTVNGWSARARDFGSTSFVIELGSEIARYYTDAKVTMFYTKTTDTAGSGEYNTLGVPMVHYSTDEQVIGTWTDGKPLYQRTIILNNETFNASGVYDLNVTSIIPDISNLFSDNTHSFYEFSNYKRTFEKLVPEDGHILAYGVSNRQIAIGYITVQYTKTTD